MRQRGVALLTALIVVAITSAIATAIFFETGLLLRRSEGGIARERAMLLAGAVEAAAARILREELDTGTVPVHPAQRWSTSLGPIEIEHAGIVTGRVVDLQGRFNLNSLRTATGETDPVALEVLTRLLGVLEIDPKWAPRIADWIDADDIPSIAGAEDDFYTSRKPSYRPPNRPITSTTELMLVPDFDVASYARLAPHVSALPRDTKINLCSASAALLDALSDERQWVGAEQFLARNRERECFPRRDVFRAGFGDVAAFAQLDQALGLGERSWYFQLQTEAVIGTSRFSLYSLLRYESAPPSPPGMRVLLRQTAE
ncbi:MAG: general secretion pathway protein GspK [Gammaproteobacteria bacterium]|nr:general secretion pathway protein GspK [Gammaproteobacteria bacterium]